MKDIEYFKRLYTQNREGFLEGDFLEEDEVNDPGFQSFLVKKMLALPKNEQAKEMHFLWGCAQKLGGRQNDSKPLVRLARTLFCEALKKEDYGFVDDVEIFYGKDMDISRRIILSSSIEEAKTQSYIEHLLDKDPDIVETLVLLKEQEKIGWADARRVVRRFVRDDPSLYIPRFLEDDVPNWFIQSMDANIIIQESLKSDKDYLSPVFKSCPSQHPLLKTFQQECLDFLKRFVKKDNAHDYVLGGPPTYQQGNSLHFCSYHWVRMLDCEQLIFVFEEQPLLFESFLFNEGEKNPDNLMIKEIGDILVKHHSNLLNEMPAYQKYILEQELSDTSSQKSHPIARKM